MLPASPPRLLLVENDLFTGLLLRAWCEQAGYVVLGPVPSAAAARALLAAEWPINVALLDIGLDGDCDGVELAGQLQRDYALPVVFLTGLPPEQVRARALALRPLGFVSKPFNETALDNTLRLALAHGAAPPAAAAAPTQPVLMVRDPAGLRRLRLSNVRYFMADGNYVTAQLGRKKYVLRSSLRRLAQELAPLGFVRIHHSILLNLRYLRGFSTDQTQVCLRRTTLPLGRTYRAGLLARLQLLG